MNVLKKLQKMGFYSKSPTINSEYKFPPDYVPWHDLQEMMLGLDENTKKGFPEYDEWEPAKKILEKWIEYDYPFFLLGGDFVEMLDNTDVLSGVNINDDCPLPFPSFQFLIPKGSFTLSDGFDVSGFLMGEWGNTDDGKISSTITVSRHDLFISNASKYIFLIDESGTQPNNLRSVLSHYNNDEKWLDDCIKLNKFIINLLTALAAEPDLRENGKVLSRLKLKRGEPDKIYREPKWIGRRISTQRSIDENGINIRCHWRRGHFRRQRFGKNNILEKIIFIKPTLVNDEKNG
jgi:hypothetical protein